MSLILPLLFFTSTQDVLTGFEARLETAFDEDTYGRYLYYCRQQNLGERLYESSTKWLAANPDNEMLLFGCAEGLLMSGSEQEAVKRFKELYRKSPDQASDIIFTLKELGAEDVTWFIGQERKRTGNATLHAALMADVYLGSNENNKALDEIRGALETGADASSFKRYIDVLVDRLGSQRVSSRLNTVKGHIGFRTAIETGDTSALLVAINGTEDKRELGTIASAAEQADYLEAALAAYRRAGMVTDAARILVELGRDGEAKKILEGEESSRALELKAYILSRSKSSYAQAVEVLNGLAEQKGIKPGWSSQSAALEFLMGRRTKASEMISGIPEDDQVLFIKALLAATSGDNDSLKRYVDAVLARYPASILENDIILIYKVTLTQPEYSGEYAAALAAYHWGDPLDAADRTARLGKSSAEIADEALLLEAESYVKLRRYEDAEERYLKLASDYSQSPLASRALFERALLQRDKMKKPEEAKATFRELILKDPASLYADLARHEM